MNEQERPYHPVANLFPMMDNDEYEQLKRDIATNGLLEPICLHPDGSILDGRNRHRACIEMGTRPSFRTWEGKGSPLSFVVSMNLHRRHLTSSQRAAIALDVLPMLEAEAKERQRSTPTNPEIIPESEQGEARDQAAALFQTNPRYVSSAKRLQKNAPDLLKHVKEGSKSITQAMREMIKREAAVPPPIPSTKYRVIYADPPWSYGNTQPDYHIEQRDHYPVMTMQEICDLPIRDLADDNSVLFLWVTTPILEESFEVISAWGFKYKALFVWDKIKHNMGHYNSVRCELLLVCIRGSCQPDVQKLFDNVQSIERTRHSEKPEKFREIIDTIYPYGRRIELFARKTVTGWDRWGNE